MIGKRYSRLLVISDSGKRQNQKRLWNCLCDCGNLTLVPTGALNSENTKSCGCLSKEISTLNLEKARAKQHGEFHNHSAGKTTSPTYQSWRAMKQRCYCPKNKDYHNYGGRGIYVCSEWLSSFNRFLSDMGERPSKDYSLDRINPKDNYYKDNCQWILKSENSRKGNAQRKVVTQTTER